MWKYPESVTTNINESIGITPKEVLKSQSSMIVYNHLQVDDHEENMFDTDTAINILK